MSCLRLKSQCLGIEILLNTSEYIMSTSFPDDLNIRSHCNAWQYQVFTLTRTPRPAPSRDMRLCLAALDNLLLAPTGTYLAVRILRSFRIPPHVAQRIVVPGARPVARP